MPLRTITDGLVGWWPFDNNTVEDISGNNITGVLVGTTKPVSVDGIAFSNSFNSRRAFLCDGSQSWITASSSLLDMINGITWMVRINATNLNNAYTGILGKSVSTNTFCNIFLKSNGKLAVYIATAGVSISYDGTGGATLATNRWYHLTLTYRIPVAGQITSQAFVNGILDGTATGTCGFNALSVPFLIGNDTGFANRVFAGVVDDVRVYRRLLDPNEIFQIVQEPYRPQFDVLRTSILQTQAPTFLSGWAQQSNYPVLGTGTY